MEILARISMLNAESGLNRKTQRKRVIRKLKELRKEAKLRMHLPVAEQHHWLTAVLKGHYAYYGLPSTFHALVAFANEVRKIWRRTLGRRSQQGMSWERFVHTLRLFPLPKPRITRPWRGHLA